MRTSITFAIPYHHQLGSHGPLGIVPNRRAQAARRLDVGASSSAAATSSAAAPDPAAASSSRAAQDDSVLYGPPRYYFKPYTKPLPPGPLRDAHEYIGKLEGWNRIQDRTIYKLKTKYKALKKTVKANAQTSVRLFRKVGEVLANAGVGGCRASDFDVAEPPAPRRPHRLSTHRQRRRRRNPSPVRGDSGNESPSMDTSSEEEGGGEVSSQQAEGGTALMLMGSHEERDRTDEFHEGDQEDVGEEAAEDDDEATASDSS